jgi:hypothetical protein
MRGWFIVVLLFVISIASFLILLPLHLGNHKTLEYRETTPNSKNMTSPGLTDGPSSSSKNMTSPGLAHGSSSRPPVPEPTKFKLADLVKWIPLGTGLVSLAGAIIQLVATVRNSV